MGSIDAYWQQHWQQWLELNEWWQQQSFIHVNRISQFALVCFSKPTFIPSIAQLSVYATSIS